MDRFRILVVDDELLIRDMLYDFFVAQEWDIVVTEDGYKAIDYLKNRPFDVVLTDIKMPDMNGLELTGKIRSLHDGLPVVLMTGYPSLDTALEALRYKVDDYIIKPFNVNHLYKVVREIASARRKATTEAV
ncbi:MAG: response regulator [candidate division Zixibacteria bacterium]|nr:response regulator [candidate division Zixibacteria bacterium]